MQRKRIYQVAREFKISSEALVEMLHGMGVEAKSHMSAVDDEVIETIKKKFNAEKEAVRAEEARKLKIQEEAHKVIPLKPQRPPEGGGPRMGQLQARVPKKKRIDEKAVLESVKKTLADLELGKKKRRKRRIRATGEVADENPKLLRVSEFISVAELAALMDVSPSQVIAKALGLGVMVTMNQRLEKDTVVLLADEFGYEVEFLTDASEEILEEDEDEEGAEEQEKREPILVPRPPVVTVMGHVDHGKTTLLDTIRKTRVVAGEVGGITQHIGAYEVDLGGSRKITFLDTPGHEAFSAMRARGAQLTDIVVLVIAADDRVMPQTVEAIDHAKAANVPILVAINKIDLPGIDMNRVKQELAGLGLTPEEWGGKTITCEVSAKTGRGIEQLLEMILLQAEVLELKADATRLGRGVVVESRRDPGRGAVASVLVQQGTLRAGDPFVAGQSSGRIRAMFNERRQTVKEAPPSTPVEILGLDGVPQAGDSFIVMKDEKEARLVASRRQQLAREQLFRTQRRVSLTDVYSRIKEGEVKRLNLIIKGDVAGSVEALADSLEKLSNEEVKVHVIHRGVGAIAESDILLAAASEAVVVGFHTKAEGRAAELAREEKVDVRHYDIIYEAVADVKAALEGLLEPEIRQRVTGSAEVRKVFRVPKSGVIAGCYVNSGAVTRNARVRVQRDGLVLYEGKVSSLKRFKDDAREVLAGFECGIGVEGWNDLREGDVLEIVTVEEVARRL